MTLPPTCITSLRIITSCLGGKRGLAATRHILTLLANSLEKLEFEAYHLLADIPLPRLTSLQSCSVPKNMDHFSSLSALTRLTVNIIGDFPLDFDIHPTVLPNLHYLCTWWTLGALLIAGRHIRVFCLPGLMSVGNNGLARLVEHASYVSHIAPVATHMEELQMPLSVPILETMEILTEYLPHLTRLYLWEWENKPSVPQMEIRHKKMKSVKRTVKQHPSLKEVVIGFVPKVERAAAYSLWRSPGWVLPRTECEKVFDIIVNTCAVVEVVRIGNLLPWVDERDVPPQWVMEMLKAEDGTWVERKQYVD
jgi:hypothetical protein